MCYIANTHCSVGSALLPGGLFLSQPGLSIRNLALCPCMSRRKIILVGAFHHAVWTFQSLFFICKLDAIFHTVASPFSLHLSILTRAKLDEGSKASSNLEGPFTRFFPCITVASELTGGAIMIRALSDGMYFTPGACSLLVTTKSVFCLAVPSFLVVYIYPSLNWLVHTIET